MSSRTGDDTVIMTNVRLPRALHDTLRRLALYRGTSLHALLLESAQCFADIQVLPGGEAHALARDDDDR